MLQRVIGEDLTKWNQSHSCSSCWNCASNKSNPPLFPVVPDVTCTERWVAICSMWHRESAVLQAKEADMLGGGCRPFLFLGIDSRSAAVHTLFLTANFRTAKVPARISSF
jgi:hypothetical protein